MKLVPKTAPYLRKNVSVKRMMLDVIIALTPVLLFACIQNGWSSIYVILISVATMLFFEILCHALMKWPAGMKVKELFRKDGFLKVKSTFTVNNITAPLISAFIYALILPAGCNWYVVFIGAVFGIVVGKMIFGGLGSNIFNPAAVGRVFVGVCFGSKLIYGAGGVDVAASGTPLAIINGNLSYIDKALANYSLLDLFLGQIPGAMGEVSALLIIVGAIYLFARRSADFRSCVSMLVSFAVITLTVSFVAGSVAIINPWKLFAYEMLSGGLLFGAVFMITDPVTSPTSKFGRIVFGGLAGALTALIRYVGAYPEGVAFSILIVNMFAPMIDHLLKGAKRGYNWRQFVGVGLALALLCTIVGFTVADDLGASTIKEAKVEMFSDYNQGKSVVNRGDFSSDYIVEKIIAKDSNGNELGFIYTVRTADKRGSITLMIGISKDYKLTGLEILTNDQSYAPIVETHILEEYINGLDLNAIKAIDVSCGATNSATKVQQMVVAAFVDCLGGVE